MSKLLTIDLFIKKIFNSKQIYNNNGFWSIENFLCANGKWQWQDDVIGFRKEPNLQKNQK